MQVSRTEDHHHTHDQIVAYVREAVNIADECELTGSERADLLPSILNLVSSKQVFYEPVRIAGGLSLPKGLG